MLPERKRAALFVLLIFLCGGLSGAVGVNLWERLNVSAQSSTRNAASSGPKHPVEWFTERLQLTSEQEEKLRQILDATHYAYKLHEQEIESIRNQGNTRIREILNDEQKVKFDHILARAEQKRRERRSRR